MKKIPKEWNETTCPLFAAALITQGWTIEAIVKEKKALCIGPECGMFFTGNKKCGLRHR